MRTKRLLIVVAIALFILPSARAQETNDLAAFRGELLEYIAAMRSLPQPALERIHADDAVLADAEARMRGLTDEELRALKAQTDRVPYWRAVPALVAASATTPNDFTPSPRTVGVWNASEMNFHSVEPIRQFLISILDTAGNAPGEQYDPQYRNRIATVRALVTNASPEELLRFETALRPRYSGWLKAVSNTTARPSSSQAAMRAGANAACTGDNFNKGLCEMGKILDALETVFLALPNAASETITRLEGIFKSIVAGLPDPDALAAEIVNRVHFGGPELDAAAQLANTYARLPCPADGMKLSGFGKVGEIGTALNFAGTIGFAGNTIQDVTPADILTSANLQAVAIVMNFPVQWLSRCLENSWNEAHDTAESDHHAFLEATLDVSVSTRASQVNVNGAQAEVTDVTTDVAKVEAKLDALGPALDDIEATTVRTIQNADRLETTSLRHDATADRIESKVDRLKIQQGGTSDLLADLEEAQLRMLIEADLVRQSNTRIALFQLPKSIGGYLELAQSIVEETLQRRSAAGIDVRSSLKLLGDGVREYGFHNYKNAYSDFRKAYQKAVN